MSTKMTKSKLRLDRESVVSLQATNLELVNGGVAYTGCDSACTQCGPRPGGPGTVKTIGQEDPFTRGGNTVAGPWGTLGNGGTLGTIRR